MLKVIITGLIKNIRPILGPNGCCRFELSCTEYAFMQLRDYSVLRAIILIIKRVLLCNPFLYYGKILADLFAKKRLFI